MTIIVADAREGVMCADSHGIGDGLLVPMRKVWRIEDSLFAGCGDAFAIQRFMNWARDGEESPADLKNEDIAVLEITREGELAVWDCYRTRVTIPQPYFALGCGEVIAMTCLGLGMSAEEAVKQAISLDEGCNGGPVTHRVDEDEEEEEESLGPDG